jgi:hypothetical protein
MRENKTKITTPACRFVSLMDCISVPVARGQPGRRAKCQQRVRRARDFDPLIVKMRTSRTQNPGGTFYAVSFYCPITKR